MIKVNLVSKLNFVLFMHFKSMGNQAELKKRFSNHSCDPPCGPVNNIPAPLNNSSNSCNSAGGRSPELNGVS